MVITQPHKNNDNKLLSYFTLVDQQPFNIISHCVIVIYRDYDFYNLLRVRMSGTSTMTTTRSASISSSAKSFQRPSRGSSRRSAPSPIS